MKLIAFCARDALLMHGCTPDDQATALVIE